MNFEYNLVWNGEVIDTAPTKKEALTLKLEYELAFNSSNVKIKRVRRDRDWETLSLSISEKFVTAGGLLPANHQLCAGCMGVDNMFVIFFTMYARTYRLGSILERF